MLSRKHAYEKWPHHVKLLFNGDAPEYAKYGSIRKPVLHDVEISYQSEVIKRVGCFIRDQSLKFFQHWEYEEAEKHAEKIEWPYPQDPFFIKAVDPNVECCLFFD